MAGKSMAAGRVKREIEEVKKDKEVRKMSIKFKILSIL